MAKEAPAPFTFMLLGAKKLNSLENKDINESLLKWSMKGRLIGQCYSFDQPFQAYQKDDFVKAFLQDPNVCTSLLKVSSSGKPVALGTKACKVEAQHLVCSELSMAFFDRLYSTVARENGRIEKCFDEYYDDLIISDELRKMLLLEDSEHYDLYSDTEREEFLFCLFKHLCLGGELCQYEDELQPYLDATKLIYKDLVSVQKEQGSGDLHIASTVFKVSAENEAGDMIYPSDNEHEQNFAYLVVDPLKRHVNVLSHTFGIPNADFYPSDHPQ